MRAGSVTKCWLSAMVALNCAFYGQVEARAKPPAQAPLLTNPSAKTKTVPRAVATLRIVHTKDGVEDTVCAPKIYVFDNEWTWIRSGHAVSPQVYVKYLGATKRGLLLAIREDLSVEAQFSPVAPITGPVHLRFVKVDKPVSIPLPIHEMYTPFGPTLRLDVTASALTPADFSYLDPD